MPNKREISHKYLEGKTKYDYCPFCVQKMEQSGENWRERLKPLKWVKTAEPIKQDDGSYRDYIDTHCECLNCGNTNITPKTFLIFYCRRYDGTKFNEPPKEPGTVWSMTKNKLVPAAWNGKLQRWEEILDKQP